MNASRLAVASLGRRKAVSGLIAAVLMFSMLFTAGVGYFAVTSRNSALQDQANQSAQYSQQQASLEQLSFTVHPCSPTVSSCAYYPNTLVLNITNTGGASSTVVSIFATYLGVNAFQSAPPAFPTAPEFLSGSFSSSVADLNVSLPISIAVGSSTSSMKGCAHPAGAYPPGPVNPGGSCNIDLLAPLAAINTYTQTKPLLISVLTASGNTYTTQYPSPPLSHSLTIKNINEVTNTQVNGVDVVTSVTVTESVTSSISIGCLGCTDYVASGGNGLILQLMAGPSPASNSQTITVNGTVLDYYSAPVYGVTVTLFTAQTGSASATPIGPCTVRGSSQTSTTITTVTSGVVPFARFTCKFTAVSGNEGGTVTFLGYASGVTSGQPTTSSESSSNPVQIGITFTIGPWSIAYYYFDFTASTPLADQTKLPVSTLCADGSSTGCLSPYTKNTYVAIYAYVTNTYSENLTLLPQTYLELISPSTDIDFYMAGSAPNYVSSPPSIASYTCTENPPAAPTGSCLTLKPGQSTTVTFAADMASDTGWAWNTAPPTWYTTAAGTTIQVILAYSFLGSNGYEVHAVNLPFQGVYIG